MAFQDSNKEIKHWRFKLSMADLFLGDSEEQLCPQDALALSVLNYVC